MEMTRTANSASVFEDSYYISNGNSVFNREILGFNRELPGMILIALRQNKSNFRELVDKRCEYLDSLKTLRNDWISDRSVTPSVEVIELAKKILIDFSAWLDSKENLVIPKLIMGPIPIGGIGIEFIVEEKFKIFLNLYNDSMIELEVEHIQQEHFIEIDTTHNSIEYLIKQAYNLLSL